MQSESSARAIRLQKLEKLFILTALTCLSFALLVLLSLLGKIIFDGIGRLDLQFFSSFPSRSAEKAGIYSSLMGSLYLMILTASIAIPLGIGAAVYLEEYAPKNKITHVIELNLANLAGVPSIIFGILGLQIFVRFFDFGRSLLAGSFTMALLILPVIVIASREAIRTVPQSLRDASLALGASKLQTVYSHVLPIAFPGILTGCILAFSRALGETAPLIMMGALTYVAFVPDSIFSAFTVLPIQTFNWISRPQTAFHANAAAAIVVLLVILLTLNAAAILLRNRLQRKRTDI